MFWRLRCSRVTLHVRLHVTLCPVAHGVRATCSRPPPIPRAVIIRDLISAENVNPPNALLLSLLCTANYHFKRYKNEKSAFCTYPSNLALFTALCGCTFPCGVGLLRGEGPPLLLLTGLLQGILTGFVCRNTLHLLLALPSWPHLHWVTKPLLTVSPTFSTLQTPPIASHVAQFPAGVGCPSQRGSVHTAVFLWLLLRRVFTSNFNDVLDVCSTRG